MDNWENAKDQLDLLDFPDEEFMRGKGKSIGGMSHSFGRGRHELESYEFYLPGINGFDIRAFYNYCSKCSETRNKYFVIYNNGENVCYERWFVRRGRHASDQD
jgi:hypothetical protein